ncbi:MAG: hypothetical protein H0V05_11010 [Euzebyaceae bacterium]|jgi:hypothetical protein|nr:hypothetical protein [Euzebyaceae bacterium]
MPKACASSATRLSIVRGDLVGEPLDRALCACGRDLLDGAGYLDRHGHP